jgi:hypothetical protein
VLGSKLAVDELIKLGPAGLLVGLHDATMAPHADQTLITAAALDGRRRSPAVRLPLGLR